VRLAGCSLKILPFHKPDQVPGRRERRSALAANGPTGVPRPRPILPTPNPECVIEFSEWCHGDGTQTVPIVSVVDYCYTFLLPFEIGFKTAERSTAFRSRRNRSLAPSSEPLA
jgi:hypothetical protein